MQAMINVYLGQYENSSITNITLFTLLPSSLPSSLPSPKEMGTLFVDTFKEYYGLYCENKTIHSCPSCICGKKKLHKIEDYFLDVYSSRHDDHFELSEFFEQRGLYFSPLIGEPITVIYTLNDMDRYLENPEDFYTSPFEMIILSLGVRRTPEGV